jgi:hypothetical protein
MNKKTLAISAVMAGAFAILVNLLVERLINHRLVADDYIISVTVGVLTGLAVFILFRKRSGRNSG